MAYCDAIVAVGILTFLIQQLSLGIGCVSTPLQVVQREKQRFILITPAVMRGRQINVLGRRARGLVRRQKHNSRRAEMRTMVGGDPVPTRGQLGCQILKPRSYLAGQ